MATDLTAADWAAMRRLITESARDNRSIIGVWNITSLTPERLAELRQRHEHEFVYARDFDAALDALARQQEANARLTAELDLERRLEAARPNLVQAMCETAAKNLHRANVAEAALADRDAELANCRQRLARQAITVQERQDDWQRMREERDALKALCRDTKGMATDQMVAERDATITRLTAMLAACAPYLKDDETPVERIERDVKDADALMTVLGQRTKELHNARSNVRVSLQEIADRDATIARLREALGDADRDIHEWMRLARRQMVELPDWEHLPCGPTSAGLAESGAVRLRIREALTPAKEADRGTSD
jgi:hypothetical protein